MSSRSEHRNEEADPLEDNELARRLRRMEWPAAPSEVKERCLAEILNRIGHEEGVKEESGPEGSGSEESGSEEPGSGPS